MLKKKILLGMLVLGSCTACITQAELIDNGHDLWLELEATQTGDFDGTRGNRVSENTFTIQNNGNANFGFWYNTENYSNIWRMSTNNKGNYYGDQSYYFRNNGELVFSNPTGGSNNTYQNTIKSPYWRKIEYSNYEEIGTADTGYIYTIEDIKNEINNIDMEIFGLLSVEGAYDGMFTYTRQAFCIKGGNNVYCNMCFMDNWNANPKCNGTGEYVNLGITRYMTIDDIVNLGIVDETSPFEFSGGPGTEGTPIACRNINTMIKAYGNKYNTGMCYTPNLILDENYQIISTGQVSIFEIFTGFEQYTNLYNLYYNNCHTPYTTEHCMNAMSGYIQAVNFFNYVKNANEEGLNKVTAPQLYQYCHLQLNFTDEEKETEGTCTLNNDTLYATGITEETGNPSPLDMISNILDEEIGIGIVTPTTGTVFDEFLEDGETRLEGISINWIKTFKEAYTKVMGLFKYRQTQQGIIPGYIVSLITIIILLALFKK